MKYSSEWPGIEFVGGCVCILQTQPWRRRNSREMLFLMHLLQLCCWMQFLLNAIIWDLSSVLHKNWNAQTGTRFGWLLGSSWFLLGKAARAAWAGCWQPQPCSLPSRWHPQPKESWRELHISSKKLPGVVALGAVTFNHQSQIFCSISELKSWVIKKRKIKGNGQLCSAESGDKTNSPHALFHGHMATLCF